MASEESIYEKLCTRNPMLSRSLCGSSMMAMRRGSIPEMTVRSRPPAPSLLWCCDEKNLVERLPLLPEL